MRLAGSDRRAMLRTDLDRVQPLAAEQGIDLAVEYLEGLETYRLSEPPLIDLVYMVRVQRARWQAKRDLPAGLELARSAHDMLTEHAQLWDLPDMSDDLAFGELQFGILLSDDGQLSDGWRQITPVLDRLRGSGSPQLYVGLNYAAQTAIQLGLDEAESLLQEADHLVSRGNLAWAAYNHMLHLAHRARPAESTDDILNTAIAYETVVRYVHDSGMTSILPIVRNLHAEIQLRQASAPTERLTLEHVWNYTVNNAEKAREIGDVRSEAAAWMLGIQANLRLDDPRSADYAGKQAVTILDAHGPRLPALRPEEVYHYAARAAAANGRKTEAEALDHRAGRGAAQAGPDGPGAQGQFPNRPVESDHPDHQLSSRRSGSSAAGGWPTLVHIEAPDGIGMMVVARPRRVLRTPGRHGR